MATKVSLSLALSALMLSSLLTAAPISDGAAAVNTDNQIQQMLCNPFKPHLYLADPGSQYVRIVNSSAGGEIAAVWVGSNAIALCLNPDASKLYVSLLDRRIAIIDTSNFTIVRNITLSFSVFSLSVSQGNRIFASSAEVNDGTIYLLDETDGAILDSACLHGYNVIVEANPEGTIALSTIPKLGSLILDKFTVSGDILSYDSEYVDWNADFRQMAIDWRGDKAYAVGIKPHSISKITISSMTLDAAFVTGSDPRGIALTADGSLVYVLCTNLSMPGELWVHNATTGAFEFNATGFPSTCAGVVLAQHDSCLWVGSPLTRIPIMPSLTPQYPAPSSLFVCTPSHVLAFGELGIPRSQVNITVDGWQGLSPSMTADSASSGSVRGNTELRLLDGVHTISMRLTWRGQEFWTNWSFSIDRSSTTLQRPKVNPMTPGRSAVISYYPSEISATTFFGDPRIEPESASIEIDGAPLQTTISQGGFIEANVTEGMLSLESYEVGAYILWAGGHESAFTNWSFKIVQRNPQVQIESPRADSFVFPGIIFLSVTTDLGLPPINLNDASFELDGVAVPTDWTKVVNRTTGMPEYRIKSNSTLMTLTVGVGGHFAEVNLSWSWRTLSVRWQFEVVEYVPSSEVMRDYRHDNEFTVRVPASWELNEDYDLDGTICDLALFGPIKNLTRANLLVMGENRSAVRESTSYLYKFMNLTLGELRADGSLITQEADPITIEEDNYSGIIFDIRWASEGVRQLIGLMVNEAMGRYWLLVGTSSEGTFLRSEKGVFMEIMLSFDVILPPGGGPFKIGPLSDEVVFVLAMATAGGAWGLALWAIRRKRHQRMKALGIHYQKKQHD